MASEAETVRQLYFLLATSLLPCSDLVFTSQAARRCFPWQMWQGFFKVHWAAWWVWKHHQHHHFTWIHSLSSAWDIDHYNALCFHTKSCSWVKSPRVVRRQYLLALWHYVGLSLCAYHCLSLGHAVPFCFRQGEWRLCFHYCLFIC